MVQDERDHHFYPNLKDNSLFFSFNEGIVKLNAEGSIINSQMQKSSENGCSQMNCQPQQEDYHFILANIKSERDNFKRNNDREQEPATNILEFDASSNSNSKESRNWICRYCNQRSFRLVNMSNYRNIDQLICWFELGSVVNVFICISCGQFCSYTINLLMGLRNPYFSPELKGRMLWEAYFQEIPDEDFKCGSIPRWKQSSLDSSRLMFYGNSKISIEDAIRSVFNEQCFDKPAWNKRYLCAFRQWITNSPNENHRLILKNSALEMGIEHIRYHSSSDHFLPNLRIYILIYAVGVLRVLGNGLTPWSFFNTLELRKNTPIW